MSFGLLLTGKSEITAQDWKALGSCFQQKERRREKRERGRWQSEQGLISPARLDRRQCMGLIFSFSSLPLSILRECMRLCEWGRVRECVCVCGPALHCAGGQNTRDCFDLDSRCLVQSQSCHRLAQGTAYLLRLLSWATTFHCVISILLYACTGNRLPSFVLGSPGKRPRPQSSWSDSNTVHSSELLHALWGALGGKKTLL